MDNDSYDKTDTDKTKPKIRKGAGALIKELPPTHPVYRGGFRVGGHYRKTSSKNIQEKVSEKPESESEDTSED